MNPAWYWHRLRRMAPSEIAGRAQDAAIRRLWRYWPPHSKAVASAPIEFRAADLLPVDLNGRDHARAALLTAAGSLLDGQWHVLGHPQPRFGEQPDWFVDAGSGRSAPNDSYAFDIPYRDEDRVGNIKNIWEPSRHQHLTMLAAAYAISGDERYAARVAEHLRSWWQANPFLRGPHWISGIEIGVRLMSWVWVRRLLDRWDGASELFERNATFLTQLRQHQQWLSVLPSRGSSANNHLVAEAAGLFVASCAFPLFSESGKWRRQSARVLQREVIRQTFPDGMNRELASEYHGFVLELFLVAAIEGERSQESLGPVVWERLRAMTDALAAMLDATGRPPRQGDGDDASGLLLDAPAYDQWRALLSTGEVLFGALPWWPEVTAGDIRTAVWTQGVTVPPLPASRPSIRPELFADAGHVYLRHVSDGCEIWCRCDHGPHGFLSIAAHGHADALAIELRVDGTEIFSDPGTYCYHGEPEWRRYFRSTLGHNTLELLAQDQSVSGGPFLWTKHASSALIKTDGLDQSAPRATWQAEHDGYVERGGPVHRRTVTLDRADQLLTIVDQVIGGSAPSFPARLALHLGLEVDVRLTHVSAQLSWPGGDGVLELPDDLVWSLHRGETNPPLGWYSPAFGEKHPTFTLIGTGNIAEGMELLTRLRIARRREPATR